MVGNNKLVATFLGRMTLMKGLPTYLKISKEFSERIDFNLCGYASPEIMTKIHGEKSQKLQINQSPSKNELERILEKSDIYISPSFYEGFGIAALEAMAFGCIPVCSMNSAINEVLEKTDLAKFIFDPFDYNSLSSKLSLLLESNNHDLMNYKKLAAQISKKYSYENFSAELFEFMDETEKHAN
jgi:glycosyltransferase involved in cell wall biosynthesis